MRVKELTPDFIANYLKLDIEPDDENEKALIQVLLDASIEYIKGQTGITDETMNNHDDLTTAVLVLVQDMYDNRRYYVDNQNVNKVVESIIFQYSENLIC